MLLLTDVKGTSGSEKGVKKGTGMWGEGNSLHLYGTAGSLCLILVPVFGVQFYLFVVVTCYGIIGASPSPSPVAYSLVQWTGPGCQNLSHSWESWCCAVGQK